MSTVISVRVDEDVKASAQEVAKSAGLTLGTLVNAYLRQIAATRRIELYAPEPMTPKLEKLIAEVEAELKAGKASKGFDNARLLSGSQEIAPPVIIKYLPKFKKQYQRLPKRFKVQFDERLMLFISDPTDPRLRVHLKGNYAGYWSININGDLVPFTSWTARTSLFLR